MATNTLTPSSILLRFTLSNYNGMSFRTFNSVIPPPPLSPTSHNLYSNQSFDSSMVLTVVVLFSALFFMSFFSIYLRRFSAHPVSDFTTTTNRRNPVRSDVRSGCVGVDREIIRSLPAYSYYRGGASKYQMLECAICLGEFEEKEIVKMIPYCKHVFHLECIGTWLRMHVTCPICRGTQLFEENISTMGVGGDCRSGAPPDTVDGGNEYNGRSTVGSVDTCIEVREVNMVRSADVPVQSCGTIRNDNMLVTGDG